MHIDDTVNKLTYFLVWPLPETAMSLLCNCLVGVLPCTHYVIRSSPFCGVKVLQGGGGGDFIRNQPRISRLRFRPRRQCHTVFLPALCIRAVGINAWRVAHYCYLPPGMQHAANCRRRHPQSRTVCKHTIYTYKM